MRRAIGIVRVSRVGGREGESFASPTEQRERVEAACERDGLQLVDVIEELDVSGGTPLERREGLRSAVETVEAGGAEVVIAAYFDRLARSLRVQSEIVQRVEAAGGAVVALDVGAISEGTATEWLSGTVLGAMNEYVRRTARERAGAAQARAIARGVPTWDNVTPGYVKGSDGRFAVDPATAPAVAEAFDLRAAGATVAEVREFLAARGIERTYRGVQTLLASRVVLGELHFGKLHNTDAHEPIVDRDVWEQVQRVRTTRGTRDKSNRLLARLGVLRCGTCGARLVVGHQTSKGRRYPFYRCIPTSDCPQRVTISAEKVEAVVVRAVRERLAHIAESASAEADAQAADAKAARSQAELDAAIRTYTAAGVADEPAAVARMAELREVRDRDAEQAAHLAGLRSAVTLSAGADWDLLTLDERRALIRATVERVSVAPGRGDDRISITLLS